MAVKGKKIGVESSFHFHFPKEFEEAHLGVWKKRTTLNGHVKSKNEIQAEGRRAEAPARGSR